MIKLAFTLAVALVAAAVVVWGFSAAASVITDAVAMQQGAV